MKSRKILLSEHFPLYDITYRFSSENKSKIQPFTYLPFSDGPRNCIGMRFALMEIKMVLIQILRRHKFVRFPDTQVSFYSTNLNLQICSMYVFM